MSLLKLPLAFDSLAIPGYSRRFICLAQPFPKPVSALPLIHSDPMSTPFLPRQAVKFDGALAQELQGDVSESIARQIVQELFPLQPEALIHDNACGYGSVTGELMAAGVPEGVKIHATDINNGYLAQLRSNIEKNLAGMTPSSSTKST